MGFPQFKDTQGSPSICTFAIPDKKSVYPFRASKAISCCRAAFKCLQPASSSLYLQGNFLGLCPVNAQANRTITKSSLLYGHYISHNRESKGDDLMICYSPLRKTTAEKQMTTYTLRFKYGMSHATVQRLQADMPVSTHTLNKLCEILQCRLEDVAVYIPDKK